MTDAEGLVQAAAAGLGPAASRHDELFRIVRAVDKDLRGAAAGQEENEMERQRSLGRGLLGEPLTSRRGELLSGPLFPATVVSSKSGSCRHGKSLNDSPSKSRRRSHKVKKAAEGRRSGWNYLFPM